MLRLLFAALVVLLSFPAFLSAQAATLIVDDDGSATAANCDASIAAYSTVGAAIAAANHGDTVLVCPGTYVENINFGGKAIAVKSVAGPAVTILDGNEAGTVVTFPRGEGAAVLEGFTIRNGAGSSGGGIQIGESSPTIRRNTITRNRACEGGGIAIFFASPVIEDNTIAENTYANCGGIGGGGLLIGGNGAALIRRNIIANNVSGWGGGGISFRSAGMPTVELNVITGNRATEGGGLRLSNHSDAILSGNLIAGNEATSSGGGIHWLVPNGTRGPLVVGNTIADNTSPSGSGIFADGFDAATVLTNNIIVAASGQTAVFCGGFNDANAPVFRFNNVFSAAGARYAGICNDRTGTDGNISSDPLFDPSIGNYRLGADSPCIDAGDNALARTMTDLEGDQRMLDGNGDGLVLIDIGADEAATRVRHVQIDTPAGGELSAEFVVSGWATDSRGADTGVDAVHVWAHPTDGSASTFLGAAEYGLARHDVAAAFLNPRYTNSGFRLTVRGALDAGTYLVVAYARSTYTGTFDTTGRVRVTIASTPLMAVDTPASGAAIQGPLRLSGWAIDLASPTGTGVDTIHIHALPSGGRSGIFLGAATYGLARPDVGAAFGSSRFSPSGWALEATLPRGEYQLLVHARSTVAQAFNLVIVRTVTIVASEPYIFIDTPARGTVLDQPIFISGWALDLGAPSGTGVDAVHGYAFPNPGSGQPPVFLGVATYGTPRPDVAAAFGGVQFTNSGYLIPVNSLQPGSYLLAVYAHSTVSTTFNAVQTVWVTIAAPP